MAKRDLVRLLHRARANTDHLFTLVRSESLYERPIPERHRLIFYLGHLEAFDWNLLADKTLGLPSRHAAFDRLFAFGIDPDSRSLPQDKPSDWPGEIQVRQYNDEVRRELDTALANIPDQRLHVAIEHRLMHAETLAYLLHNLPYEKKNRGDASETRPVVSEARYGVPDGSAEIPAGETTLGRRSGDGFGWDNEFEEHTVHVPAFAISRRKVTNGEYLEYVRTGAAAPHFWVLRGREYFYRGMFTEIPLPLDWPVYVTHDEASAYAAWKGKDLPSESQFHRAAYPAANGSAHAPDFSQENVDFRNWDPVSVDATPSNAFGVCQMVGNGWEWTSTVFHPFPGFQPFSFYPGYSADFYDGQHYVLKGGSPRTAACMLRPSFRNWFRPSYPYLYSTFRLVEN